MTISRDPGIQLNHENQTTPKPHQRAAGCNEVGHARTYGWRGQVEWLAFGYAWMRFIRRCEPLKGDTAARYLHLDEKGSFQLSETGIRGFWHLVGRNQLASSSGFKSFDFYTHIYIYIHTYVHCEIPYFVYFEWKMSTISIYFPFASEFMYTGGQFGGALHRARSSCRTTPGRGFRNSGVFLCYATYPPRN